MRLLLDSHTVIWAVDQPDKLGNVARSQLEDAANELLISAATIWEIAIKVRLGSLDLSLPYHDWMAQAIVELQATILPVTVEYAQRLTQLPFHHRDPFDRLIAAQAFVEGIAVVSSDRVFDPYGLTRIW